jgi:ribosomal protein L32E
MIAKDLYRLRQEVEKLEEQIKNSPVEKQERIKDSLRKLRAEQERMRRMLEGAKEPPAYRKPH